MPNRVGTFNTFAGSAPPWSLPNLDANFSSIATAFNDASLGYNNYIGTDTGGANAYIVSCTFGAPTTYNVGMTLTFKPANTNTGASTINVNALGTMPIQHGDGTACIGGEIQAGKNISLIYNGTAFQIQGPSFGYGTTLYYDYDDFVFFPGGSSISASVTGASKLCFLSGAGTGVAGFTAVIPGHPGVMQITSPTQSGGTVRVSNGGFITLDGFTYTLRWIIQTPGTIDTTQIFCGLKGSFSTPTSSTDNSIGFFANNASAFWQMYTTNGSAQTLTPTTQSLSSNTWYDVQVVANAAGATFFINGTQVGTQNTTYPASSTTLTIGAMLGSTGTARTLGIDLFEITITGIPILSGSTNPRFAHGYV